MSASVLKERAQTKLSIGIGSYIKQLEDYQNRTDGIVRRVQVVSQDAGDATNADEYFVPAIVAQMQRGRSERTARRHTRKPVRSQGKVP